MKGNNAIYKYKRIKKFITRLKRSIMKAVTGKSTRKKYDNIVGKKFSRWTVIGPETRDRSGNRKILCKCECGKEQQVSVYYLKNGVSKKCRACFYKDRIKSIVGLEFGHYTVLADAGKSKTGALLVKCMCACGDIRVIRKTSLSSGSSTKCYRCSSTTHNMSQTPTYKARSRILYHCYNKESINYKYFGGLGITVCDRWRHSFENFYADMGDRPKGLQLGRIDKDGNYGPDNCRWVTPRGSSNNRRSFKSERKANE